jgi:hypothetical protein
MFFMFIFTALIALFFDFSGGGFQVAESFDYTQNLTQIIR